MSESTYESKTPKTTPSAIPDSRSTQTSTDTIDIDLSTGDSIGLHTTGKTQSLFRRGPPSTAPSIFRNGPPSNSTNRDVALCPTSTSLSLFRNRPPGGYLTDSGIVSLKPPSIRFTRTKGEEKLTGYVVLGNDSDTNKMLMTRVQEMTKSFDGESYGCPCNGETHAQGSLNCDWGQKYRIDIYFQDHNRKLIKCRVVDCNKGDHYYAEDQECYAWVHDATKRQEMEELRLMDQEKIDTLTKQTKSIFQAVQSQSVAIQDIQRTTDAKIATLIATQTESMSVMEQKMKELINMMNVTPTTAPGVSLRSTTSSTLSSTTSSSATGAKLPSNPRPTATALNSRLSPTAPPPFTASSSSAGPRPLTASSSSAGPPTDAVEYTVWAAQQRAAQRPDNA